MTHSISRRTLLMTTAGAAALPLVPAFAESHAAAMTHEVQMLNKHPEDPKQAQVFFPRVITVNAGDTVVFKAVDRGHNSASIDGMMPEGAEEWKGKINADAEVTFDTPGFYGYECTPHASTGMVGLVIVKGDGMMDNLEDAKGVRQRGKARQVWSDIWEEVDAMELA